MTQAGGGFPGRDRQAPGGPTLPVSRPDVVGHAQGKGADADEITASERSPDREFKTVADILKGIGQVDAPA